MRYYFHWFDFISIFMLLVFGYGLVKTESSLLIQINIMLKIIIALYLIYRFNDFQRIHHISLLDQKLCSFAGFYLIITSFASIIKLYLTDLIHYLNLLLQTLQKITV